MKTNEQSDFEFLDFTRRGRNVNRLEDNAIRVTHRKNSNYLTINTTVSEHLRECGFTHLRLRKDNITKQVHFVFNKENKGLKLVVNDDERRRNILIACKELVDFLLKHTGRSGEGYFFITIGNNVSNSSCEYATYEIKGSTDGESY